MRAVYPFTGSKVVLMHMFATYSNMEGSVGPSRKHIPNSEMLEKIQKRFARFAYKKCTMVTPISSILLICIWNDRIEQSVIEA